MDRRLIALALLLFALAVSLPLLLRDEPPHCVSAFVGIEKGKVYAYVSGEDDWEINAIRVFVNAQLFDVCPARGKEYGCRVPLTYVLGKLYRLDAEIVDSAGQVDRCPPYVVRVGTGKG